MTGVPAAVRVLLLDDQPARAARLRQLLERDPRMQVVGHAAAAAQALDLAAHRPPDVVLAGITSPAVTRAWIRTLLQVRPLPVVVVASGTAGEDLPVFALVQAGALAVLREPAASGDAAAAAELLDTLHTMAEVRVVRRWARPQERAGDVATGPGMPRGSATTAAPPPTAAAPVPAAAAPTSAAPAAAVAPVAAAPRTAPRRAADLVAIGASTGGPVALQQLLCGLPAGFPVPILVVQHMAAGFVQGLADWLSASCALRIAIGSAGNLPLPGHAYLAPDGAHLRLGPDGRLRLDAGPLLHGHRPAVEHLFDSLAVHCGARTIAILLTGMGQDGAAALKRLRDLGALTIAQDQASSVVHGMPGEAIRLGAATRVMNPRDIAAALPALVSRRQDDKGRIRHGSP